jgi:hypothetical protein
LLTGAERAAIQEVARDVPALWNAPTTTAKDRKELLRALVHDVVLDVRGESDLVHVTIRRAGGRSTEGEVVRSVARYEQLSYYPQRHCQLELVALGLG